MTDQKRTENAPLEKPDQIASPEPPAAPSQESEKTSRKELTADEQMALYEEDLKENDWGHQPC
jgi:hypothetical protein